MNKRLTYLSIKKAVFVNFFAFYLDVLLVNLFFRVILAFCGVSDKPIPHILQEPRNTIIYLNRAKITILQKRSIKK